MAKKNTTKSLAAKDVKAKPIVYDYPAWGSKRNPKSKNPAYPSLAKDNHNLSYLLYYDQQEEAARLKRSLKDWNRLWYSDYKKHLNPNKITAIDNTGVVRTMGKGYVQNNNASKQAFAAMMFPILKKKFNERMSRYTGGKPFAGDKYDVVTHNLLAQLLTESGWGTEVTGDYNYYGIKLYDKNKSRTIYPTTEWKGGKKIIDVPEPFANYASIEDGMDAYMDVLFGKKYDLGNFLKGKTKITTKELLTHLYNKGYFTQPLLSYMNKIENILNGKMLPNARKELRDGGYAYEPMEMLEQYEMPEDYLMLEVTPSLMAKRGAKLVKKRFI